MIRLHPDIAAHLRDGGTLLVPSRQRASAVRLAFNARMLGEARRVWSSPDVLPWSAWLERQLSAARERGVAMPRRLTPTEDWLLWQSCVHEACAGLEVLMPDGLIDPVRRAAERLDDYGIELRGAVTAEVAVLQRTLLHYRQRCLELGVLARVSWRDLQPFLQPVTSLMLAGFAEIGPARWRWLSEQQARVAPLTQVEAGADTLACESAEHEAQRVARWCASRLAQDSQQRLLVVVPRLDEQRHWWERALSQYLDSGLIVEGLESSTATRFAFEGGRPLADYRLVAAGLDLLALGAGEARFEQLSELLRCPYLTALSREGSLSLDHWLRDRGVRAAGPSALRALVPWVEAQLGEACASVLRRLLEATQSPAAPAADARLPPASWAQCWADELAHCGWPGSALSGDEQQVRMRFDQLLGDFAAVNVPTQPLTQREACARLRAMASRVAFEPATDDVPVTVTARLEDPIVSYDGVWVAGLSADVWPSPARPDPLLPLAMQLAAGMPEASPDGQARLAQQLQRQWQQSAPECHFSWSHTDPDTPGDASPLLPAVISVPPDESAAQPVFSLEQWLAAQAPELQIWSEQTSAVPPGGMLRGGTRLLELQALCPFHAFAELRLQAVPLESPQPGVNPKLRGMILHRALELFWGGLQTQTTLRATSTSAREQLAQDSVAAAILEVTAREPVRVNQQLMQREHARTVNLIVRLIDWELQRPAFGARVLESAQRHRLAGTALELRLDRVDELEDGGLLVIDYKSGAPAKFDATAERLTQPQLPAYAQAMGERVAAVITLYLGREGVKVRGLADQPGRLSRLPVPREGELSWTQRRQRWEQQLAGLMEEFLRGEASVRPQPDACKFCHLHLLCRIDAAALAALDTDPDAVETEEGEEEQPEDGE